MSSNKCVEVLKKKIELQGSEVVEEERIITRGSVNKEGHQILRGKGMWLVHCLACRPSSADSVEIVPCS